LAVTSLGTLPLSAVFPGFGAALAEVNAAFARLAAVVNAQAHVLLSVHVGMKSVALDGLLAQLAVTASIQLPDPTALLAALARIKSDIEALVPAIAQLAQVNANVSAAAVLKARIAALNELLNGLLDVHASLSAAIVFPIIQLADPTLAAFLYDGSIEQFGTEMGSAMMADATLGARPGGVPTMPIRSCVLVVRTADAVAFGGLSAAMAVSAR
jgi:hypothetical protein